MAKMQLKHVKTVRSKGHVYYYFNTGQKKNGNVIYNRLPDPSAANFFQVYAAMKAGRTKRENVATYLTVSRLIDLYERSNAMDGLSDQTRRIYTLTFRKIEDELGNAPIDDVKSKDIVFFMDKNAKTPGAANTFLSTVGALYKWARKRGHTDAWPTRGIEKLETGEHDPWPQELIDRALSSEIRRVRLATHLLLYTGQRISDVCNMRWNDIEGGTIKVVQQKTGKYLKIPLHKDLAAELARTPKEGLTILVRQGGKPVGHQTIRKALQAFAAPIQIVPHGLRKNAVIELLTSGCTIAEVASITGQTFAMVEHYAKQLDQEKFAGAAILKWENG